MARSVSIWVVRCGFDPVAAFTVKHELVTWLKKQIEHSPFGEDVLDAFTLYKCKDNPGFYGYGHEFNSPEPIEIPFSDLGFK